MNTTTTIPTRSPVVAFDYPDSGTNKMKLRYVKVAEATADYVKGNEFITLFFLSR